MIRRDVGASEIPWCAAHGTGVIVYSPMQSGLLTDSFTAERVAAFPPDDWRRQSPQYQPPKLAAEPRAARRAAADRGEARRLDGRGGGRVDAALAGVTAAIVGARSPQQVDGWLAAAALTLDAADLDAIAAAIASTGAGSGPTAPA